jgi:hypothetical protein
MPPKTKGKAAKGSVPLPRNIPDLEQVLRTFLGGQPGQFQPDQIDQNIRHATTILQSFIKEASSILALFTRISMVELPQDTRQLACVLLTKVITKYWFGLQKTHHFGQPGRTDADLCRDIIMNILHGGTAPPAVIHSLSYLTFLISRADINKGRWPAILEWLSGALNSTNLSHVDASLRILSSLLKSSVANKLLPYFDTYSTAFQHWFLNAPTNSIRNRAVLALHPLLDLVHDVDEQEKHIDTLLPVLLGPLQHSAQVHDYDTIISIVTMINSCLGSASYHKHALNIVQALCPILLDIDIDMTVRSTISQFLCDTIAEQPLAISSINTLPDGSTIKLSDVYLQLIFGLLTEQDDNPFNLTDSTAQQLGCQLFENCAQFLPRDLVYPLTLQRFVEFVQSPNIYQRKAAYVIVMICSVNLPNAVYYGDKLTLGGQTDSLLAISIEACCATLITEKESIVQQAVCIACTYLCENLGDAVISLNLYEKPCGTILKLLETTQGEYRKHLFLALDAFCEITGKLITPLLPEIMRHLMIQLQIPDIEQQSSSIVTISSLALAAQEEFLPYFPQLLPIFHQILNTPPTSEIELFQHKTMIAFASACGCYKDTQGWPIEIKSGIFGYLDRIFAALFEDDLSNHQEVETYVVFLSRLVPSIASFTADIQENNAILSRIYNVCVRVVRSLSGVKSFNSNSDAPNLSGFGEDELEGDGDNDNNNNTSNTKDVEAILRPSATNNDGELDDEDLAFEDSQHYFETASLEAKLSTIRTISLLIDSLGPRIYNLEVEDLYDEAALFDLLLQDYEANENDPNNANIQKQGPQVHENVPVTKDPILRIHHIIFEISGLARGTFLSTCLTLLAETLTAVIAKMVPIPTDVGIRHPLPQQLTAAIVPVVARLVEAIGDEDDSAVVTVALESLTALITTFGCSILYDQQLKLFYEGIGSVLTEAAPCFVTFDEKDDYSEQGQDALASCCVLLQTVARQFGPLFKSEFLDIDDGEYVKTLTNLCHESRPVSFRAPALGCLADIVREMPNDIIFPLAQQLLFFCQALPDANNDPDVLHNTIYLIATTIQCLQSFPDLLAQVPAETVQALFQITASRILTAEQYKIASLVDAGMNDNAVPAAFTCFAAFPQIIPSSFLPQILSSVPLSRDPIESAMLVKTSIGVYNTQPDVMKPFTGQILAQIAYCISGGANSAENDMLFTAFGKSLIQQFPQEASTASGFISGPLSELIMSNLRKLAQ